MKSIILIFAFTFSLFNLSIDTNSYYHALKSKSLTDLNSMIQQIEKEKSTSLHRAYKGVLIAKKSMFEKKAGDKVKVFKSGIKLLETEIKSSPKEIEYRFLRLTLQENSPKILKYNKNIDEDIHIITNGYPELNSVLKKIILDYSKNSTRLNSSKLK